MKIGLFFGSFNPVHIGHLIIASLVYQKCNLDKIWFVLSPQNPLKQKANLLNEYDRLHLLRLAIGQDERFESCTVEFSLPKPSYTVDTLLYLRTQYPEYEFNIIIGADILPTLPKWKNYEILLENYSFLIISRDIVGVNSKDYVLPKKFTLVDIPLLDVSSSEIRTMLKQNVSIKYLTHPLVEEYIHEMNLYK